LKGSTRRGVVTPEKIETRQVSEKLKGGGKKGPEENGDYSLAMPPRRRRDIHVVKRMVVQSESGGKAVPVRSSGEASMVQEGES